jgi:hypothetical protein
MSHKIQRTRKKLWKAGLPLIILIMGGFLYPGHLHCETFGIVVRGNFEPKVTIDVKRKRIVIRKIEAGERFRSISLQVNPKNSLLVRNVSLLKIEWISAGDRPGRPIPFAGPHYNAKTKTFQDTMVRSIALAVVASTTRNLFEGKAISDLFIVKINDEPVITHDEFLSTREPVGVPTGSDGIKIGRTSVTFDKKNYKKGEILDVDNRSGKDQVLGIELPSTGLLYYQVIRKPEQTKIPKENWDRFTVAPDYGIFIVLIPEPDPEQLARLDGKEIVINIYDGFRIADTRRITIRVAADLRSTGGNSPAGKRWFSPSRPDSTG